MKKSMSDVIAQILIILALIIIPTTLIISCIRMSYTNDRLKELIQIEKQSNYVKQWQKRNPLLQKKDTVYLKVVKE
ncbi:hypothetical protein [Prevotella histicola]|uniref:hypothetical protein n=1 Tax=Prevotella histicola TaxID=470565 RepID=UPI0028EBBFC9|nr:hypothetical protein [Prevotella histicola]